MKFLYIVLFATFAVTCIPLHASEVTFAKWYLADGIIVMKELSQGDFIASSSDHRNPTLIRFDSNGNVVSGLEYVVRNRFRTYFDQLIETSDGGYVATGGRLFNDPKDPIIVKFDSTGFPQWHIVIPGKYHIDSIAQTADGGFIAAGNIGRRNSVETDAWILKLNRVGRVVWSKIPEEQNGDRFQFVQQTLDGGYIVAGTVYNYQGTIEPKLRIAKLDAQGKLIWNHIYSSTERFALTAATLTSGEGVVLVGNVVGGVFLMKVGSNGGIHWAKAFSNRPHFLSLSSVVRTKDGGYVAAGSSDTFRGPDNRGLLLKVNALGKLTWSRRSQSELFSVDQTHDSGLSLSGMGNNFYGILKTNARGFIPGCSLLRRFPLSARALKIERLADEELELKSISIGEESFSITPKKLTVVEDQDYCN